MRRTRNGLGRGRLFDIRSRLQLWLMGDGEELLCTSLVLRSGYCDISVARACYFREYETEEYLYLRAGEGCHEYELWMWLNASECRVGRVINDQPEKPPVWFLRHDATYLRLLCSSTVMLKNTRAFASCSSGRAQHLRRTRTCRDGGAHRMVAHTQPLASCSAPLCARSGLLFNLAHMRWRPGRTPTTSSLRVHRPAHVIDVLILTSETKAKS